MFQHLSQRVHISIYVLLFAIFASACSSPTPSAPTPTYDPFIHVGGTQDVFDPNMTQAPAPTRTPGPTPTRAPLSVTLYPHDPILPLRTPTPDSPHAVPTQRLDASQYTVLSGDTLGSIAQQYGISVDALMSANKLTDANTLAVGQTLTVPAPEAGTPGPAFKIIPDSELVYGPASTQFDVVAFVKSQGGYLASYSQDVGTETMTGAEVVVRISQDYSVNPRLLLALLEHRSKWVTSAAPNSTTLDYPLGFVEQNHKGLYHQLSWAANELNRGFYLWRANAVSAWVLNDGNIVPINPGINAGTASVENLFSKLDDRATWDSDVNAFGLFQTYSFLFGSPYDFAIEPLLPPGLIQPHMDLPFEPGVTWAFTGGPHGGWDSGSAWAAVDFAPLDGSGCAVSAQWETAVANGYIVRAQDGAVMEDLDGDGYEQTGWDVLYMHVAEQDRVQPGTFVYAGDHIGHPSCEGGISNATHLHLARKYNGEWIGADGNLPFNLSGWISSGVSKEYDGFLKRGVALLEAAEGINNSNQLSK